MRRFLAFTALALAFGLAACDSTSSNSSWTGDAALVGTWKSISSDISSSDSYYDTTTITLGSGGKLSYVTYEREVTSSSSTLDTNSGTGTWSSSGTKLYVNSNGEKDSSSYTISGTKLTLIDLIYDDTEVFTRQ
jgi:hypothetical protein